MQAKFNILLNKLFHKTSQTIQLSKLPRIDNLKVNKICSYFKIYSHFLKSLMHISLWCKDNY